MTTNERIYTIPLRNTDKTLENEVINFETKVLIENDGKALEENEKLISSE